MIYLIGGAPRCGKTTFSKMLSQKKRIPWFSTDLVAAIVSPYISKKEKAKKLPVLNVCTASPKLLLRGEIQNAKTLWPGTKRLILASLKWKHDYIIEGVHLLPQFLHELATLKEWETMRNEVRIIYFVKKDEQEIIAGLKKSNKSSDWLLQCINTEADMHNAAKMVQTKSMYIEKQANSYGFRVVNTERDFQKTLKQLLKEF